MKGALNVWDVDQLQFLLLTCPGNVELFMDWGLIVIQVHLLCDRDGLSQDLVPSLGCLPARRHCIYSQ